MRVWRRASVVVAASYASWARSRWRFALVRSFFAAVMAAARVEFVAVARTCFAATVSPTLALTPVTVQVPVGVVELLDEDELEAAPVVGALPNWRSQLVAAATAPVAATSSLTSATVAAEVR